MKNITRKILSMTLILSILCSFGNSAFAMNNNNVVVLQDDKNVRIARAYIDGEESTVSFYKQTGIMEIEEKGVTRVLDTNVSLNLNLPSKDGMESPTLSWWGDGKYQYGNSVFSMGYKVYYNEDENKYTWKLDGHGFNSRKVIETSSNARRLQNFKDNIDTSEEYWTITKGALIGAGAAGIVGIVLAMTPEPFLSKAGATAALVAAGASASAALAAGGSYYVSCKYYNKAREAYNNI